MVAVETRIRDQIQASITRFSSSKLCDSEVVVDVLLDLMLLCNELAPDLEGLDDLPYATRADSNVG